MTTISNAEELKSQQVSENDTSEKQPRKVSNLLVRFFTGIIALPIILLIIFLGGWFITIALGILMLFGILEFYFMEKKRGLQNNAILGVPAAILVMLSFHFNNPLLWQGAVAGTILITFTIEFWRGRNFKDSIQRVATTIGGVFYIAFPMAFLVAIRGGEAGLHWFFAYVYCTWGTDTFAYLIGNMFGKTKLAPVLSPKKTVEGAVGGILAGAILPLGVLYQGGIPITLAPILLFITASFAATTGDLFESRVKRFFEIKDSHIPGLNILPGHGGVLDRIDSTLFVAPVMYIYLVWAGNISLLI
ncbi:MAG: phosphatidate cytidylyltransferase [Phototrophicaceae bacterium]